MTDAVQIPDAATPYILYQRTSYMKLIHSLPYRALRRVFRTSLYKPAVMLESCLRKNHIKRLYADDMANEYRIIRDHLPPSCASILDIGCGIAAINVFFQRHYKGDVDFHLLDKTGVEDEVFYQFNERGAFYNSLDLAASCLKENGIPADKIHLLVATDSNEIKIDRPVDLIVSLISWGFHYPVSTYLDRAYECLAENGRLIVDVRANTGGAEEIRKKFGNLLVIEENATRQRVLAVKNKI